MIVSQVITSGIYYPGGENDCKSSQYPQVYTTQEEKMIVSQVNTLRCILPRRGK